MPTMQLFVSVAFSLFGAGLLPVVALAQTTPGNVSYDAAFGPRDDEILQTRQDRFLAIETFAGAGPLGGSAKVQGKPFAVGAIYGQVIETR